MLSMTCPCFRCVAERLNELTSCKARDEVFLGVVSAIGSNKVRKTLFESCGSFFLQDGTKTKGSTVSYSKEDLEAATMRMKAIMKAEMTKKDKVENHV